MIPLLVQFLIAIIVVGFLFWALQLLLPHVPLPAEFRAFIDVGMKILVIGVLVFYFVIPLIKVLPSYVHL